MVALGCECLQAMAKVLGTQRFLLLSFLFYSFNDTKLYILNAPQLVLKVELFFVISSEINIVRIKQGYFVTSRINQVHLNFS